MKTMLMAIAALAVLSVPARGDTLVLKDGRHIQGTLESADGRQISMLVGGKIETFSILNAVSLFFGDASAPTDSGGASAPVAEPASQALAAIPAGAVITVRTIDPIDSRTARAGQTFRASLDEPLVVNNQTLAPKGADAFLKLAAVKQSGKIAGAAEITIAVDSVTINGRPVAVETQGVTSASEGRGKKSAEVIGAGAALGALIGGLTRGGRGAALGGAAGAGAGTAVQMATKGQRVWIPAETRLSFTVGPDGG